MPDHSNSNYRARLILLGASNLTRGISTVVETARLLFGSPLDIFAALGHGRSYGMRSSILFGARALPGILECGLWRELRGQDQEGGRKDAKMQSAPSESEKELGDLGNSASLRPRQSPSTSQSTIIPTFALLTDIGNDIIYGSPPLQVANWIEQCIDRLEQHNARIAMTMLPIESIRAVRRWQYAVVKTMLFPTRQLKFEDAIRRANELHELIVDLAQRRHAIMIEPRPAWYGFDPIHVRFAHWPTAWAEILSRCAMNDAGCPCARPSIPRWARLRLAAPQQWWLLGHPMGRTQPALRLSDGSAISLF